MTDPVIEARDDVLRRFAAFAAELFAEQPARRSALLAVAQYWNDSADDEVHAIVTCSTRDTPVWPHECVDDYDDGAFVATRATLAGEACERCGGPDRYFAFYGGDGDPAVAAFELFCREGANQDMEHQEAYLPFAIARRRDDGVALEIVGRPQRPPSARIGAATADDRWSDPRTRALFDEVCRSPDDDAPRVVLSDRLLEARPDDPRAEAITLSLAPALDAASRARRDELVAAHLAAWIHPLGAVIPPGCAHVERGFLAHADVHARTPAELAAVRGAPAWGTVEVVRIMPGSLDVVDPEMIALRDIGPLGADGVAQLRAAPRPWSIERLHVELDGGGISATLADLARVALPRVRHLALTLAGPADLDSARDALVAAAPWWRQLTRLTVLVPPDARLALWSVRRPSHTWLAVTSIGDDRQPAGWEVAFGPDAAVEITPTGWHFHGTMHRLAALVRQLPDRVAIRLRSTPYRACGADEAAYLRAHADRDVAVS